MVDSRRLKTGIPHLYDHVIGCAVEGDPRVSITSGEYPEHLDFCFTSYFA
jgi:hypothetical protein